MEDLLFKTGLIENNINKIKKVPKVDVHNHMGLGMKFDTLNTYLKGILKKAPSKMNGLKGLDEYIFTEIVPHIANGNDIDFLIESTIKEAIADGITRIEPSMDCHDVLYYTNPFEFFHSIKRIKEKYQDVIDFRPELGMAKDITGYELDTLLIPCIDSQLFYSIDLYGDESRTDFSRFKHYYKYARKKGMKLKVHAGEFEGSQNVLDAIEILDVDAIQHGVNAVNSDYVMGLIKERNIQLNICPTSNEVLGSVKDIKYHPARKLFDYGIKITINTDDLLLFHQNISDEFLKLYNLGLFNEEELNQIRKNDL